MFVLNMRLKPSRRAVAVGAMMSGLLAVICVACMVGSQTSPSDTAVCDELGTYSLRAENTEQQVDFLAQFGIEVDTEDIMTDEIVIPEVFNSAYDKYNELQKQIGLNLESYKGRDAQKITYRELDSGDMVVLLVADGMVIGGHRTTGELGTAPRSLLE